MTLATHEPVSLRARWVVPIDRPPIAGGVVTVAGGRILAVEPRPAGRPIQDLGDVALLPGLVNAHTHLEFSRLDQPLGTAGAGFADWIRGVIAWRRASATAGLPSSDREGKWSRPTTSTDTAPRASAFASGLAESRASGVAALGEIATSDWQPQLAPGDPTVVIFRELLGLSPERVGPNLALAAAHVARCRATSLRGGLSPHAPYTVHPRLLEGACRLSAEARVPLAMHLAESREELELLAVHRGPLVELLESLGAWHPDVLPAGRRALDYLRALAQAHRALVIHGNYLAADEIEFLAARREQMALVYCPRTHAYFGHAPYPLVQMLSCGVRVAIGTDSRASNPDLSLWHELVHIAARQTDVAPAEILRLGTLAGAEALGLADTMGSLTPGKQATLVTVPLAGNVQDVHAALLHSDAVPRPLERDLPAPRGGTS